MAWTAYQLALAVGMVITGSINTLATKWADRQTAPGCDDGNTESHMFNHPFLQAVGMFIGEFTCMIAFKTLWFTRKCRGKDTSDMGNQNFSPFLFFIPAMCDMAGTSLMYVGLNFTYASSFQMLRGAVIVFTALLSVAFLRRIITNKMWSGIACVILGLVLVGLSDFLFPSDTGSVTYGKNEIITGDLIIIIAQIIAATQMVVEEKFVSGKDINPLQAVGWEGFFGMTTLGILLIPMYFIVTGHTDEGVPTRLEDSLDGFCQLGNNWQIAVGTFGSITSIAFFNFFGISITKELSATTRMVLDSIRTLVIWIVSLALKWEAFQYLQVIGFVVLLFGTMLYNNIVTMPECLRRRGRGLSINRSTATGYDEIDEKMPILPDRQEVPSDSEA
ncbi:solute carrier family 35 member F6-like [Styela clava]|uniref:solute carrier family 35 member F6-like n=1 Tax=Styela clava TaxID=7725 RepID=UPI0019396DCC|nr:solute carrier family 35 member F6-like [Styela clava]XP_039264054.1 solute carrier family 35 member F6-like [Styela clava]